jgi:hypothetical protein
MSSIDRSNKNPTQIPEVSSWTHFQLDSATPEPMNFLGKQGIPWEVFRAPRKPVSEAHNRQETPLFARSIERHALRDK